MAQRKRVRWIVLVVAAVGAAGGLWWWLQSRHYESTDDAEIEGRAR